MSNTEYKYKPGHSYPSGSKPNAGGVNFSIFTRHASSVALLLFKTMDCKKPFQTIQLEQEINRTFYSWHVYVINLPLGLGTRGELMVQMNLKKQVCILIRKNTW
jgi:glycogen operon protein